MQPALRAALVLEAQPQLAATVTIPPRQQATSSSGGTACVPLNLSTVSGVLELYNVPLVRYADGDQVLGLELGLGQRAGDAFLHATRAAYFVALVRSFSALMNTICTNKTCGEKKAVHWGAL